MSPHLCWRNSNLPINVSILSSVQVPLSYHTYLLGNSQFLRVTSLPTISQFPQNDTRVHIGAQWLPIVETGGLPSLCKSLWCFFSLAPLCSQGIPCLFLNWFFSPCWAGNWWRLWQMKAGQGQLIYLSTMHTSVSIYSLNPWRFGYTFHSVVWPHHLLDNPN